MAAGLRFGELSTFLFVWSLFFPYLVITGYVFDSIAQLKSLVDLEYELGQKLKAYVDSKQDDFERFRGFAKLVENETSLAKAQGSEYVNNPISAFSMIKRFIDHWTKIDLLLKEDEQRNGKDFTVSNGTITREK